ncbi:MAG: hypothetical protein NTY35_13310 [Planctomycetota bacterium]|nr:hypothetical protein [Planctomycetota bacterium]
MIGLLLVLAQSAPAPASVPDAAPVAAAAAPVEAWDRPFAEGLAEIRRRAEAGAIDDAVAIAERLAVPNALARQIEALVRADGWRARAGRALESVGDALDLVGPPPAVRAEAQYARAVALSLGALRAGAEDERALRREQARLAFESARLLAGPGVLRLDATYDQGLLAFGAGEEQRALIPEISGKPAQPPAPAPAGAQPAKPPDPLQLARSAYVAARERFVERLRMDWRDPDTQASVELVQRRLRELAQIERKREEEKQKQEEQQKDDQKDQQKQDQKDPKKDQQKDDSKDPKKPEEPQKQDPSQDQKPDQKPDPKEPQKQPDPQDAKKPEDAQKPEPKPGDAQEAPKMSKEEMLQLLERLQKIEDVQQELQEKLKRMRKVSVEKDW